jgi:ABC-type branched-subunit amino acid transport system ATPase component
MVKLIMGPKGTGKTKALVELVKKAVEEESGSVVCLEKDKNLTYDVPYTARLIHASDYNFGSFEFFRGFISGLHAANYDITHVFIDIF